MSYEHPGGDYPYDNCNPAADPKDLTTEELLMWAQVILEEAVPEDDVVRLARELASRLEAARTENALLKELIKDHGHTEQSVRETLRAMGFERPKYTGDGS